MVCLTLMTALALIETEITSLKYHIWINALHLHKLCIFMSTCEQLLARSYPAAGSFLECGYE